MATHGTLSAYIPNKEDWSIYIERMEQYFVANDVTTAAKKRAILLSACGSSTYTLIRSLLSAEELKSTSYINLVKLVKDYYEPKPSVIVLRWKFNIRCRQEGESLAAYAAALRNTVSLGIPCQTCFGID